MVTAYICAAMSIRSIASAFAMFTRRRGIKKYQVSAARRYAR